MTIVCQAVADHMSQGIACAVGSADDQFCMSVAVEIVDDERHVVSTRADVDTQIDAPETSTVETVAVEECRSCIAVVGIVVGIGGIPFQDDLILSVAIDISH